MEVSQRPETKALIGRHQMAIGVRTVACEAGASDGSWAGALR
jgi:hypothetical protein